MISTPITNINSLPFGSAELRLADSLTHINDYGPVLNSSSYLGGQASVRLNSAKSIEYQKNARSGVWLNTSAKINSVSVTISLGLLELNSSTLSALSGGSNSEFLRNLFSVTEYRAELYYSFPNGSQLIIILPKVVVSNNLTLSWVFDNIEERPLELEALSVQDEATWQNDPLGRMILL